MLKLLFFEPPLKMVERMSSEFFTFEDFDVIKFDENQHF